MRANYYQLLCWKGSFSNLKAILKTDTLGKGNYTIIKTNFKNSNKHIWKTAFQSMQHVCKCCRRLKCCSIQVRCSSLAAVFFNTAIVCSSMGPWLSLSLMWSLTLHSRVGLSVGLFMFSFM